jgi:hypothetical protein
MLRDVIFCCLIVSLTSIVSGEDGKVPLKTEIPEEVLVGTPPDVLALLFPNLEKLPEDGKVPEFLVPEGTKNLSVKKKVTGSDSRPLIGDLKLVTDGDKGGSEESYVELAPGMQWVQIDLGQTSNIYAIYLWHFYREARSYHDVIIQASDDPEFKKDVTTIYSNDQDNSAKKGIGKSRPYIETNQGKLIDGQAAKGRYVRLYSAGNTANDLNHYVEVEVFGKPAS